MRCVPRLVFLRNYTVGVSAMGVLAQNARIVGVVADQEDYELGAACLKNGSDQLGCPLLIRHTAHRGLPRILSTGMATEQGIAEAVEVFLGAGGRNLVLLAFTSVYPTPPDFLNLRRITSLAQKFDCPAGFSDHSAEVQNAVPAAYLGACMIEKNLTTDRSRLGPDQWFSSDHKEFAALVRSVLQVEAMLRSGVLQPTVDEGRARGEFRLACAAARDLPVGCLLSETDIVFRRSARGIPPVQINPLNNRCLRDSVRRGISIPFENLVA